MIARHFLIVIETVFSMLLAVAVCPATAKDDGEWIQLFNGKDLKGWKTHPKNPGKWRVERGILISGGKEVSHLFSERDDYQDFHYRIEAKISDKGNSGQLFRAAFAPGYPAGYEAQINSTFPTDPVRTGSLYPAFDAKLSADQQAKIIVKDQLHKPDEWFTQEVIARGNHIIIKVNDKTTVDFVDEKNTYTKGHLALQQHAAFGDNPQTVLQVRKIEVKELSRPKTTDGPLAITKRRPRTWQRGLFLHKAISENICIIVDAMRCAGNQAMSAHPDDCE